MYSRLNKVDSYTNIELVDEKARTNKKVYIIELEHCLELQGPINEALGRYYWTKIKIKIKTQRLYTKTIEELQFYQNIGYKNSIEVLLENTLT